MTLATAAPQLLVMLDYDGTLAPFRRRPDRARPWAGVRERLAGLRDRDGVRPVIVSGRPARSLLPLLALVPPLEIWGAHGRERLCPDGRWQRWGASDAARAAMRRCARTIRRLAPAARLEWKAGSLAVHWRGLARSTRERLQQQLADRVTPSAVMRGLLPSSFNGGIEYRVPGRSKGDVVRTLVSEMGPECPALYLGDDHTDEDAFAALRPGDLGVLVGREPRPSLASVWLKPPKELTTFLDLLSEEPRHGPRPTCRRLQ